jgi:hypothetical protein
MHYFVMSLYFKLQPFKGNIYWGLDFLFSCYAFILSALLSEEAVSVPRIVLQRHCTENSKQTFPEMKLRGLVPQSYIHESVHLFCCSKICGPIVGTYKSLTDT